MRAPGCVWIVCLVVGYAGIAAAEPRSQAQAAYKRAVQLTDSGDYDRALADTPLLATDQAFVFESCQPPGKIADGFRSC